MPESVNFDRIADRYDETRGGEARGRSVATQVGPHLPDGRLLEIGVGTGLIAAAFASLGREVIGIDLSEQMLAYATERVPGRVIRADASAIPLQDASVDACAAIHVLHLVADTSAVLGDVARVLRSGGRLAVVGGGSHDTVSDVDHLMDAMSARLDSYRLRAARSQPEAVIEAAERHGLRLVERFPIAQEEGAATPEQAAAEIEARLWSRLWDLPDDIWASVVEPTIKQLRQLPGQDRPRPVVAHSPVLIFEATAGVPEGRAD
ncbi:methyltransferase domain-containing protein [Pseudofrankia sp. BMG5.37]|uniref:methyltransferase domain-containing protein n=1 Tax=Pseudofrankia sp. BMG5.37 TaxID=3050035 RepID=UPI002895A205|nr:methyltransferase domain-containing protein [Pseudofrankia sp. BMG5.37]MDT3444314.1 methyltransferase domain-containing protein [Pseudofrankia sp. BMG5.37]